MLLPCLEVSVVGSPLANEFCDELFIVSMKVFGVLDIVVEYARAALLRLVLIDLTVLYWSTSFHSRVEV